MGCDIHFFVERREDNTWVSADKWLEPETWGGYTFRRCEGFYSGRNYDLFAILAGVRNGRGFAGITTGTGFIPISKPRGLPEDASPEVKSQAADWYGDGHSYSWLLLKELLDYDWDQQTMKVGVVGLQEYLRLREVGDAPRSYAGWISGSNVKVATAADVEEALVKGDPLQGITHVQMLWPDSYRNLAQHFLEETLPRLQELGAPEDVRIVFWFDN